MGKVNWSAIARTLGVEGKAGHRQVQDVLRANDICVDGVLGAKPGPSYRPAVARVTLADGSVVPGVVDPSVADAKADLDRRIARREVSVGIELTIEPRAVTAGGIVSVEAGGALARLLPIRETLATIIDNLALTGVLRIRPDLEKLPFAKVKNWAAALRLPPEGGEGDTPAFRARVDRHWLRVRSARTADASGAAECCNTASVPRSDFCRVTDCCSGCYRPHAAVEGGLLPECTCKREEKQCKQCVLRCVGRCCVRGRRGTGVLDADLRAYGVTPVAEPVERTLDRALEFDRRLEVMITLRALGGDVQQVRHETSASEDARRRADLQREEQLRQMQLQKLRAFEWLDGSPILNRSMTAVMRSLLFDERLFEPSSHALRECRKPRHHLLVRASDGLREITNIMRVVGEDLHTLNTPLALEKSGFVLSEVMVAAMLGDSPVLANLQGSPSGGGAEDGCSGCIGGRSSWADVCSCLAEEQRTYAQGAELAEEAHKQRLGMFGKGDLDHHELRRLVQALEARSPSAAGYASTNKRAENDALLHEHCHGQKVIRAPLPLVPSCPWPSS
jgi:hypothetical protein